MSLSCLSLILLLFFSDTFFTFECACFFLIGLSGSKELQWSVLTPAHGRESSLQASAPLWKCWQVI